MTNTTPSDPRAITAPGFALGMFGLLWAIIPVVGVFAAPLLIAGYMLCHAGSARADRLGQSNSMAIAGLVVSLIGLAFCGLWVLALIAS